MLSNLISEYGIVCRYNYEVVCSDSLFSYFCYKLKKNGINTKIVPIIIDNETVDYDYPDDLLYMREDLTKVIELYSPDICEDLCEDRVNLIFKKYCELYYTNIKIDFFDDFCLIDVLKKAKNCRDWNKKFESYKHAKERYLEMDKLKLFTKHDK